MDQQAYRVEEVAQRLQTSTDTVYRLVREGRLRKLDLGTRTVRISARSLEEFLAR